MSELKPLDGADINLVELRFADSNGRLIPCCKKHGAMNKLTPEGIWRCLSMYAWINCEYGTISKENKKRNLPPPKLNERTCLAGCFYDNDCDDE